MVARVLREDLFRVRIPTPRKFMTVETQIKHLREIEGGINKHLYLICGIVTVVIMAMTLVEFFSRGLFSSARISLFYLGVLLIYSLHKEILRWLGKRRVERQGEYFVYAWITLTTLLYIVNFISRDYFYYSVKGEPITILKEISLLTIEVLAIFIFTRCLKILKIFLVKSEL